jgi:Cu2+-exporting ATPase
MCCYGCQAVAQAITNSDMEDFYKFRTKNPSKPDEILPEFLQQLKAYDNPVVQKQLATANDSNNENILEISLILEGIVCAACVWLNENHISAMPGVLSVNINYSNHRARVRWDNNTISLSEILESIKRIGYTAHPYDPDLRQRILEKEKKQQLRRIGLAGILGMQVMILAVAMYTGEWWGMNESFMKTFRWTSLFITVPILIFSSRSFFSAAIRDLNNFNVGMDVPVSLGIGIAFIASVANTLQDTGAVYFDSIAMFTFFLLTARYFETNARKRAAESTEALLNLQPAIATKLINDENNCREQISIAVAELKVGDHILVRPGENIPADGTIIEGASGVNESLVTGESLPLTKTINDDVIGGSTNIESPLVIRVNKVGKDTVLASIHKLIDDAQNNKPAVAKIADRLASKFVAAILLVTLAVAIYWYQTDPEQWVKIAIATLVVSCPCALSLATPTAITAASGQLAKLGLLPTSALALETLARATDFVFDKTGTLTKGNIELVKTIALENQDINEYIQIAAALESGSEHPIAKSIIQSAAEATNNMQLAATEITNKPGKGISGIINSEKWFLGNVNYINENCESPDEVKQLIQQEIIDNNLNNLTVIALATEKTIHALFAFDDEIKDGAFAFDDEIKDGANALIRSLQKENKSITLMTGDHQSPASRTAQLVGIKNIYSDMKPADKLERVRAMQKQGSVVAMSGDGINDAPVLAGADIAIAMGSGTRLAAVSADMILLSNHIDHLYAGYLIAKKTSNIIRQNLGWAIAYNLVAVPAAATGHVEPWLAALGMSASSLIVVLNALRLTRMNN